LSFLLLVGAVGILAGATAGVAGFGIGSLLTPLLALQLGGVRAVAAVVIPHAAATALRAWRLRRSIDWAVVRRFGLLSAAGGLGGALLFARLGGEMLMRILGALLIVTALSTLSGVGRTRRAPRSVVPVLGFASGFFGGVVGNQGGLRAAALLALGLEPAVFVATSTMTGLLVDAVRGPVYLWRAGDVLAELWPLVGVATAGTVIGTLLGERMLFGLSPERFRQVIAGLIGLVGVWLLVVGA
jgi:hypothetical protein